MKKSLGAGALFLLASVLVRPAAAQSPVETGFGVGALVGDPTGVSLSLPLGADNAINALIGHEFTGGPNVSLLGEYVWRNHGLVAVPSGSLSVFYGPGARVRLASDPVVSVHAALGLDYVPPGDPLQLVLEIGPGINVVPDTEVHFTVGLGARYFF